MADIFFIVIPIIVIVVILKLCLICWRIWLYQKRREVGTVQVRQVGTVQVRQEGTVNVRQQMAGRTTARVVSVRRVACPEGIAQQTCFAIQQPGCAPRQFTRTVIIRPTDRPLDPNLPPTYDQAVSGKDRSVKVDEGQREDPSAMMMPSAPPPSFPMYPPGSPMVPPPPYVPSPSQTIVNLGDDDDGGDADYRSRLLS